VRGPLHNSTMKGGELRAKKRLYTVYVVPNNNKEWQPWYCPDCRNMVFRYKGDAIIEVPGEAPVKFPVEVACKNGMCGRRILVADAAEQMI